MKPVILGITLVAFSILTAAALWQHGYWGIVAPHFQNLGAGQVFADLVIALTLAVIWMWRDARTSGRSSWPWLVITVTFGSVGPLFDLLAGQRDTSSAAVGGALGDGGADAGLRTA